MAETVELTVQYYDVGEKSFKGGAKIHSIKTQDGSRYSAFVKSDQPLANPGDKVKTQVEENSKGYVNFDPEKFKVLERGKGHQQNNSSGGNDDRQGSIVRQNAMTQANTMVAALVANGRYDSLQDEEIAEQILYLAENYFFPYGAEGKMPEPKNPVSDLSDEMQSQASDDEEFNDDVPF